MDSRFLKTIRREAVDATPVWIMRQAGRYLPEYRASRQKAGSFLKLCKTPELVCEVTLQPLARYDLDAAIIFSDILTIPDAMGLGLHFVEGEGPQFERPIKNITDIENLSVPDPDLSLRYVLDAIRLTQHELKARLPLIGFCGSPFTLAAYMVEGRSVPQFPTLNKMLMTEPKSLQKLLALLSQSVFSHLSAQITAGVNAVMIFDTWGGLLNTENYPLFSLNYIQEIVTALKQKHPLVPVIVFTKGGKNWLEKIAATACDVVGLDWEITLNEARSRIGHQVALQGNMHPACLLSSPDEIRAQVSNILASYGKGSGHIFNLGHGITPDVPPENVAALIEAVHELSRQYHE